MLGKNFPYALRSPKVGGLVPHVGYDVRPVPRRSPGGLDPWTDSPGLGKPSTGSTGNGEAHRRKLQKFKILPKNTTEASARVFVPEVGGPQPESQGASPTSLEGTTMTQVAASSKLDSRPGRVRPRTSPPQSIQGGVDRCRDAHERVENFAPVAADLLRLPASRPGARERSHKSGQNQPPGGRPRSSDSIVPRRRGRLGSWPGTSPDSSPNGGSVARTVFA